MQNTILRYSRLKICATPKAEPPRQRASILVGLLWCVALLSVLVVGMLYTARLDLIVVKNHGDLIQAHYLALAGIEKAKALLYQDAISRRQTSKNHTGELYNAPQHFRDVAFGRGQFRILRQGSREEGGAVIYGIRDEESRLNVNYASADELKKLYGMTPEVIAAIMDYRDEDNNVSPGGAEAEYYASLQPPYLPRNGPLLSIRELLMVRGVSRELLLGEDANQNGLLDAEEDDGDVSYPPDNRDGILDAGWSGILTVDSTVRNVNAAGQSRVNIQSADENDLAAVPGVSSELAKAIVAGRNQNRLESLADLLDVSAVVPQNPSNIEPQAQPQSQSRGNPPQAGPGRSGRPSVSQPAQIPGAPAQQATGPKLVSEDLLTTIADELTAAEESQQKGAVNINTASVAVLACLPGIEQELAQAIVSYRQSSGFFSNVAWLLKVPGMTREIFKKVAPRVTARSETFRILSEGKVNSSGARQRIEVVVHLGSSTVETLSYREDL